MKKIIWLLLLLPLSLFGGTIYYVDNINGSDNYNGMSQSTPWRSLTKVNAVTLLPGDNVLFKCGGSWNGTLTVSRSGSSGNPIVFGQYGTGANPLISGFDSLVGWIKNSDSTWSIVDTNLGSTLNLITINGINQAMGRLPKTSYYTYTAVNGNSSITDATRGATLPSCVGGTVVIRKNHWILDRGTITAQSNGTINYNYEINANAYKPTVGYGYFIQNHLKCLTQFGDWCYDASTHKITMYFGSSLPTSYSIKASHCTSLINIPVAQNYINFTGIDFIGANNYGLLAVNNCSYINFTNCNFSSIGQDGLNFKNGNYITVRNCSIVGCNNVGFSNTNGTFNSITNSLVKNINMIPGSGQSGEGSGIGIALFGPNPAYSYGNSVTYNTVSSIGYHGISVAGNGFNIQNNYVDSFCITKDDGGGIYTYVGPTDIKYSQIRVIANNTVSNGFGAIDGTLLPAASSGHGIYLDDNSSEVSVTGNQIAHCAGAGINGNTNRNCTYTNNTISDCGRLGNLFGQIRFTDNDRIHSKMTNLVFTDNTLTCKNANQMLTQFRNNRTGSNVNDFAGWGNFNNNTFSSPFTTIIFFYFGLTNKWPGVAVKFSDWQTTMKMESVSVFTTSQ